MSDRDTFGPRLRGERERRGITLDTIATVTKVGVDLWDGLERNDFSRWPSGIFARAFVRDYAKAVGLDSDEVVDEFCRLFPIGDRRANRIIKAQAELIGHDPSVIETQPVLLPPEGERRSAVRERRAEVRARRFKFAPRTVAAVIDVGCAVSLAAWGPMLLGTSFWAAAGVTALFYYGVSTIVLGATPGTKAVEVLRQRVPALFTVHNRHAAV
jgi:transcriptional regulator with XRE-family HTH domain